MSDYKDKNRYENVDFFAKLACGGNKRLVTRIPRMQEIPPLDISHRELRRIEKENIEYPVFDIEKEYADLLEEKKKLKAHYMPFTAEYYSPSRSPIISEKLTDFDYRKETEADRADFASVLNGDGEWDKITVPHYTGPVGKWNAFYRKTLLIDKKDESAEYVLDFEAADYIAEVYVNGRLAARHEGFFAPFSATLTPYVKSGENTLLIVIKNDVTVTGVVLDGGIKHYGDKIYANTHLGYDEPELGWHHCPPGAGIFGNVRFIKCKKQRVTDIFAKPDTENSKITVYTTVYNFLCEAEDCKVCYTLEGRNFRQTVFRDKPGRISRVLCEENFLEETFELPDFKVWTQDSPYLYEISVALTDKDGNVIDEKQTHFGMRSFVMDENSVPKGKFYLNGERIILRGANEMGHFPNAVMRGDFELVIDDILTAKAAGLNFYRFTQRPVFDVLYTYFDMFGMMCQTDFPAFLFLRDNMLGEAYKQLDEMERLTRNHPSVVIESFCNETADSEDYCWEQYGMGRNDMEKFFEIARRIVGLINPQRVVKYCDGDYSAVEKSYGVNDFHCYTYWYNAHGVLPGKFDKGYLPPFRKEWMAGCGEYGVDGLDNLDLMYKYYPKEWLPKTPEEPWTPKRIAQSQCFSSHGNYFPEQTNIKDWIRESQNYQREAIKLFVHGLRRRVDYVQSSAVHLLIDAWPAGWTKTLVGVDRVPKPAYYAFKEANIPVRVSIRRDKYVTYNDEEIIVETFGLNDTTKDSSAKLTASVYFGDELVASYSAEGAINAVSSTYLGDVVVRPCGFTGKITVVAKMEAEGRITFDKVSFETKERNKKAKATPVIYGKNLTDIAKLCENTVDENVIFCDNTEYRNRQDELERKVSDGARVVIFTDKSLNIFDDDVLFKVHVVAEEISTCRLAWHSETNPLVKEFPQMAFHNFYNANKGYYDLTAWFKFNWQGSEELLYSLADDNPDRHTLHKSHKSVMAIKKFGKGEIILTTLTTQNGFIGHNPYLDKLLINIIDK